MDRHQVPHAPELAQLFGRPERDTDVRVEARDRRSDQDGVLPEVLNRLDAMMVLHATESVLVDFGMAVTRLQLGTPDRCPSCSSYQMASDFRTDLGPEPVHVSVCSSCGWSDARGATLH